MCGPDKKVEGIGGADVRLHIILTSAVNRDEWPAGHPGHFVLRERMPCPLSRGWAQILFVLDDVDYR